MVEVAPHPKTGEEVRVGLGQGQRAELLGVTRETLRRWDQSPTNVGDRPTHIRRDRGQGQQQHGVVDLYPITDRPKKEEPVATIRTASRDEVAKAGRGPWPILEALTARRPSEWPTPR